ncbi:unnamed protein product [Rotaria sp. Silwood2]|nr:unnamed protein product [Rotaria sp. Silwood2]
MVLSTLITTTTTTFTSTTSVTTSSSTTTTSITTATATSSTSSTTSSTTTTTTTTTLTTTSATTTTTTTTITTTTTTSFDSCTSFSWNQTGEVVAGTGSYGKNANQLDNPDGLYIDANDTLFISDTNNERVQSWTLGNASGTTVAGNSNGLSGLTSTLLNNPVGLTFDKNGFMYVVDSQNNRVQRFPPNSLVGTTVAGQASGSSSTALNSLKRPLGVDVDDDLNVYVADGDNQRVVKWTPNATTGILLIDNGIMGRVYGILLAPNSTNQVYLSDENRGRIYLWTFNATNPNTILNQVNGSIGNMNMPRGIIYDMYNNLYVADAGKSVIIRYCVNSTVGNTVVGGTGTTPTLGRPSAIAFDSNYNLYVADESSDQVVKYARL